MTDQAQQRIGDYEIVRELGHGGMGQVYLVRNILSDRIEAMKVLLPDLAQQQDLANRFMREIKVLASLDHPNIAQLRTALTVNNQLVMIMEYVEGDTLAHRLERGAFSSGDILNYMAQVLSALSYAHGKGIIHRDIKPANMMLTPQGVVKLMDFGIARSTQDLGMTTTGTTLGSLDYMSPEQVKGETTDARSDLYSVGVSLYEMATGRRMFSATSSFSVMEAHVKEVPRPPIELQPTVPKALSDIIMMAVAKDPAQRFQTADAFRNALSQVGVAAAAVASAPQQSSFIPPQPAQSTQATATPTPPPIPHRPPEGCAVLQPRPVRERRHVGWIVVAAIVVLVALFGGTQVYRSHKQNNLVAMQDVPSDGGGTGNTTPGQTTTSGRQQANTPAAAQPAAEAPPPAAAPAPSAVASSPVAQPHTARSSQASQEAAAPAETGPSPEEIAAQKKLLDDMETEMDQLDGRATAVESSLSALEQQMRQDGLGMRGDIVASRENMRTDLAKAKEALQGSDTDRARKYLDQANHEIQKIEAFLGRR
jgi:eukaryotic-like serine/threonine-protein kinase